MKLKNKKGFTMAELLIVIAIIAVLIAVAFPVFGAQLAKAEYAVDVANVRAAYSEAVADALMTSDYQGGKLTVPNSGWLKIKDAPVNGYFVNTPAALTASDTANTNDVGKQAIIVSPPDGVTAQYILVDEDILFVTE